METHQVDAFDFCRGKDARSGETPVREFGRLAAEVLDQTGSIRWSVQGSVDGRGTPRMDVQVSGMVVLRCQRCLAPMDFQIDSAAAVAVAADDDAADALDETLSEEPVEVVVGSSSFDLLLLVEDEVLLTLPPAPRHQQCIGDTLLAEQAEAKESPFAVLGKLKN